MDEFALYPLKFQPILKSKIWGGQKLSSCLNKDISALENCGETWEISGVETEQSVVSNGFLQENELNELVETYMGDLVGDHVFEQFGNQFPLLFKYIDANDYLSVQVHPDDALALARHNNFGKTEMWYVVEAAPDAVLISGFNQPTSKESYLEALEKGTIKDILRFEKAEKGDVFYIPAGRIHAIGPGIVLAEIQQTSDITYRIYDWQRKDEQGNYRELHTDLALDAINFSLSDSSKKHAESTINSTKELVRSKYFVTNQLIFDKKVEKVYATIDSFVVYMCLEGSYTIAYEDSTMTVNKGETVLIPAIITEITLIPHAQTTLLEVYIP
jgi:mannose-6-phosphate isomerase